MRSSNILANLRKNFNVNSVGDVMLLNNLSGSLSFFKSSYAVPTIIMKVLNFNSNVFRYHLASSHGHMLAEDESDRPLEKIDEECTNQSEEQPTDSLTGLEEALEELRRYEDGSEETHQFSG